MTALDHIRRPPPSPGEAPILDTLGRIADALEELREAQARDNASMREELERMKRQHAAPAVPARMVWVQDLAEAKGTDVSTIYRHLKKWDVPRRQKDGFPKAPESRERTYVFSLEYEQRGPMHTSGVRRDLLKAGQITRQ